MKNRFCILILLFLPSLLSAEEAKVVSFKHTVRWLKESNFPNYFQDPQVRDSIYKDLMEDFILKLNVSEITFLDDVEYRLIKGFGKPNDEISKAFGSTGYMIDLFSLLTRETAGFGVNWSVTMIIRKDGKVIFQKVVTKVIENVNAAGYLSHQCWWSADEFRKTFRMLTREALELEKENPGKVMVGAIRVKEEEVRSWFPNSNKLVFITRGDLVSGDYASAQLMHAEDTILQFELKPKSGKSNRTSSTESFYADLITEFHGLKPVSRIVVKEQRRAIIESNQGAPLLLQMEWVDEYIDLSFLGTLREQKLVPMIGGFYEDELMVGKFVYSITAEVNESVITIQSSLHSRPAVIHEVKGILHGHEFTAEYDELSGQADITIDSATMAVMILQNWNPANINAYMGMKVSENRKTVTTTTSPSKGAPKLEDESKQEWYALFMNDKATPQEQLNSIQILASLFFSIGIEQEPDSED